MVKDKPLLHLYYPVSDETWGNNLKEHGEIPSDLKELTDKLRKKYSVGLFPSNCLVLYVGPGPAIRHPTLIKSVLERLAG